MVFPKPTLKLCLATGMGLSQPRGSLGSVHLLVNLKRLTVVAQNHDIGAQTVHALLTAVILLGVEHDRVSDTIPMFPDAAGIAREQNIALTRFHQHGLMPGRMTRCLQQADALGNFQVAAYREVGQIVIKIMAIVDTGLIAGDVGKLQFMNIHIDFRVSIIASATLSVCQSMDVAPS